MKMSRRTAAFAATERGADSWVWTPSPQNTEKQASVTEAAERMARVRRCEVRMRVCSDLSWVGAGVQHQGEKNEILWTPS